MKRRPKATKRFRLRGRYRLGAASDPDRMRRVLSPAASLEDQIEDFVGWMTAGGFSAEDARRQGEWIRDYHRQTGKNFLRLPVEEQLAFTRECDRQLDELEAEELADVDPNEPQH